MEEENVFNPEEMMSNLEMENEQLKQKNLEYAGAMTAQSFSPEEDQNLIQYQLETDKILERIEHFLKGDVIKFSDTGTYFDSPTKNVLVKVRKDIRSGITYYIQEVKDNTSSSEIKRNILVKIINNNGSEVNVMERDSKLIMGKMKNLKLKNLGFKYVEVIDEEKKPLNEYGVAEFMRIISMYLTKETFLSYYTEERIFEIMADLGDSLNNFLYCNYEKMGMDSKFKESKYTIMILNILHTIESCYRRAIGGAEQYNLRSRAIVTQSQGSGSIGARNMARAGASSNRWNPLKPSTW
jgi:hypothetical protein